MDLNVDSKNLGDGSSVSVGAVFPARAPVESLPAFARTVEAAGLDELWLVEDCFLSGGLTMAATALAVSEKITVGIGLMPAVMRNPALAAMEIATLARLHPGRFTVALGHGVPAWMAQIGATPRRRMAALEDAVVAIRALLRGATVTIDGADVRLDAVALDNPPEVVPPVVIGTTGPRGLKLAGERADGFLLPEGCGPDFVEWATATAGHPDRGVPDERIVYAWARVDDDAAAARPSWSRVSVTGSTAACTPSRIGSQGSRTRPLRWISRGWSTGSPSTVTLRPASRRCGGSPSPARPGSSWSRSATTRRDRSSGSVGPSAPH